jgi:hypothetical protein
MCQDQNMQIEVKEVKLQVKYMTNYGTSNISK